MRFAPRRPFEPSFNHDFAPAAFQDATLPINQAYPTNETRRRRTANAGSRFVFPESLLDLHQFVMHLCVTPAPTSNLLQQLPRLARRRRRPAHFDVPVGNWGGARKAREKRSM